MKRGAAILVLGLLAASPAFADGFRCGTKLVREGATRSEVAAKCGEPDDVITHAQHVPPPGHLDQRPAVLHRRGLHRSARSRTGSTTSGLTSSCARIRFEGGVVAEIETLGYGYNK